MDAMPAYSHRFSQRMNMQLSSLTKTTGITAPLISRDREIWRCRISFGPGSSVLALLFETSPVDERPGPLVIGIGSQLPCHFRSTHPLIATAKVVTMFARSGLRSTQRVFAGARNGAINVTKVNLPPQTTTRPHERATPLEVNM